MPVPGTLKTIFEERELDEQRTPISWENSIIAEDADKFSIQLNGDSPRVAPVSFTTGPLATIVKLQGTDLRVGSNVIELGIILAPGSVGSSLNIFELRLTVEYTFMA